MQSCVEQGLLREEILKRTLVPYYTRTVEDIREAMEMAKTIPINGTVQGGTEYPGSFLSLIDVAAYNVVIGKETQLQDNSSIFQGSFDMFWSIHQGAIRDAGATDMELEAIRIATRHKWEKVYNPEKGINVTYVACVIRKRTREAWSC